MTRTTRREALGAGLFTTLAGVAAVAVAAPAHAVAAEPNPDAELIALCDRFDALERDWYRSVKVSCHFIPGDPREAGYDAEQDAILELMDPIADQIAALPTHTLAGYRARAKCVLHNAHGDFETIYNARTIGGQILASIVRDLAGEMV